MRELRRLRSSCRVAEETPFGAVGQRTIKIEYFLDLDPDLEFLESQMWCDEWDLLQEIKRNGDAWGTRAWGLVDGWAVAGDGGKGERGGGSCGFSIDLNL